MSDFYQTGVISTLHRFPTAKLEKMDGDLKRFQRRQPVTLLLPSLWSEFEGPAMPRIVEELKKVRYLHQIVLVLDRADETQFRKAREHLAGMASPTRIIWNDGPRVAELYSLLERSNIPAGLRGKGRSVWMGMGYILSDEKSYAIALHDCDILTYSRELLARLCFPVSNTSMSYEFVKGYGMFKSVKAAYLREAQEAIRKYNDDAAINGLHFDRHAEGTAIETFAQAIDLAAKIVLEDPLGAPLIPNWNRVTSAIPDFLDQLRNTVEEDNR